MHPLTKIAEWTNALRARSDERRDTERIGMTRNELAAAHAAAEKRMDARVRKVRSKL